MKIQQMSNGKGGTVKNQFVLYGDNGDVYFQSYQTIIVKQTGGGETFLDRDKWDYSVTTGKYRNLFLGETKKETEKKIKSGTYKLANLNG